MCNQQSLKYGKRWSKKKNSNWHLEYQAFSYLQTTTPLVNESNRFSKEIHCSSYFADKNNENNNNNQIKKTWLINHQIITQISTVFMQHIHFSHFGSNYFLFNFFRSEWFRKGNGAQKENHLRQCRLVRYTKKFLWLNIHMEKSAATWL